MPCHTSQPTPPQQIWGTLKNILQHCNERSVPTGTTNTHHNPYWNTKLSISSRKFRKARKGLKCRSSPVNGDHLNSKAKVQYLGRKSNVDLMKMDQTSGKTLRMYSIIRKSALSGDLQSDNGEVFSDDHQKARNPQADAPQRTNVSSQSPCPHPQKLYALHVPITMKEIQQALTKLRT